MRLPDFALICALGADAKRVAAVQAALFAASDRLASGAAPDLAAIDSRLSARRLTVVDASAWSSADRQDVIAAAKRWHAPAIGLVMEAPLAAQRSRDVARQLEKERFRAVHLIPAETPPERMILALDRIAGDQQHDTGPFDIIGDVHGCATELITVLTRLDYAVDPIPEDPETLFSARHPAGRRALFLGDFTDRGPRNLDVLRLAMGMTAEGTALGVLGNHDEKLRRWLLGRDVSVKHGLERTVSELSPRSHRFQDRVVSFLDGLAPHLWLADGALVAAHAGLEEAMHGRDSKAVRRFALFGDITGERDAYGLPMRLDWAARYQGAAEVVYGHTPAAAPVWRNRTICLDTACVFGGALTALRWPERTIVSVPAAERYAVTAKPFLTFEADGSTGAG